MPDVTNVEAVINAAQNLSFEEWLKVSKAITRAFVEKEHGARRSLMLDNTERIKYFFKEP